MASFLGLRFQSRRNPTLDSPRFDRNDVVGFQFECTRTLPGFPQLSPLQVPFFVPLVLFGAVGVLPAGGIQFSFKHHAFAFERLA